MRISIANWLRQIKKECLQEEHQTAPKFDEYHLNTTFAKPVSSAHRTKRGIRSGQKVRSGVNIKYAKGETQGAFARKKT